MRLDVVGHQLRDGTLAQLLVLFKHCLQLEDLCHICLFLLLGALLEELLGLLRHLLYLLHLLLQLGDPLFLLRADTVSGGLRLRVVGDLTGGWLSSLRLLLRWTFILVSRFLLLGLPVLALKRGWELHTFLKQLRVASIELVAFLRLASGGIGGSVVHLALLECEGERPLLNAVQQDDQEVGAVLMIWLIRPEYVLAAREQQLRRLLLRIVIELRQDRQSRHDLRLNVIIQLRILLHDHFVEELEGEELLFRRMLLRLCLDHFLDSVYHLLLYLQRRLGALCA